MKNSPTKSRTSVIHYTHHVAVGILGLTATKAMFGSLTVWEALLFFFAAYMPVADEFLYATLHYLESTLCRNIINVFFVGETKETLALLHAERIHFTRLTLHNFPVYAALLSLLFVSQTLDWPLLFYGTAGLTTHLLQDIINDYYEFTSLKNWLWPLRILR